MNSLATCASAHLRRIPLSAACINLRSTRAYKPISAMAGREIGRFNLSPSSSLVIGKGDITVWSVNGSTDAIVNPANKRMVGGGGADGAIHRAAGPELRDACWNVPEVRLGVRCPTGEARITDGFRLPASHVIHTVGPVYDVDDQPEVSLANSYRSCLTLAKENGIEYIAFPAISCGVFRYPLKEASTIAISVVKEFSDDLKEDQVLKRSIGLVEQWNAIYLLKEHHVPTTIDIITYLYGREWIELAPPRTQTRVVGSRSLLKNHALAPNQLT